MIPLVVEIEIVNVRIVEDHGYDLGIEVVQHVVVRAGRGEGVVLTRAPEHCFIRTALGYIEGRVRRLQTPRLFPFYIRYRHVVTCCVGSFCQVDVGSVGWS